MIDVNMNTSDAEKELTRLKKKVFKLEGDLGENALRKSRLEEELRTLNATYDAFAKEHQNASGALAKSYEDEANTMLKTIEKIEKEIAKVDGEIKEGNIALDYAKMRYGEISEISQKLGNEKSGGRESKNKAEETMQRISALNQELEDLQRKQADLGLALGAKEEYDQVSNRISEVNKELEECQSYLDGLAKSGSLSEMANSAQIADQRIAELKQRLLKLQEQQARLGLALGAKGEYDALSSEILEVSQLIEAYEGSFSEAEQRLRDISESAVVADQYVVDLAEELKELQARQRELKEAGVGIGHQEYDDTLKRISEINRELREYQDSLLHVEETKNKMGQAAKRVNGHMSTFGRRLKDILASAFIFNILSAGLRQFTTWAGKSVKTNDQARQAIARLKGALLTLAQPLIEVVIPAFTFLVNILARVVTAVAQLVSAIFGKTLKQSKDGAKAMYEEANAIKGVGAAADEAAGSLAGFDEINTISTENASGAGGGISSDAIKPDFTGMIEGELSKITALVGAALLAVGAILTFSGANIPLGIALMAAGAVTLVSVIATDWGSIAEMLRGPIGLVTAIISTALLALGAILAFSGVNIPLGIALMALGALGLVAVVAANWNSLSEVLQGPIGLLTAIISGALLVVGALLAFSGVNIPLGIALMALGAIGLATVIAINWESLSETLQGPIGRITAVVSGALLALGALLAFSGVNIPLGIALMALGAVGLSAVVVANWAALSEVLQGPIGTLTAVVSGALLALGALLAFSGVNIPLGIPLMAAGAIGLVAVTAANWDALSESLRGPIGNVTSLVSVALLALGAILSFSGVNIPLGLGLLAAGAIGLAATIAVNWDSMEQALKGPTGAVTALISAALLALGAVILFSGANIPMGLGLLVAGAAGLAASIAANWETIQTALQSPVGTVTAMVSAALLVLGAVLLFSGANIPLGLGLLSAGAVGLAVTITANWDTITTATGGTIQAITAIVSAALLVLGVVLLFTGAAAPLGLGLMAIGAVGLAATIVPNWDFILEAVRDAWSNLKNWWDTNVAKFFTLDYWAGLGKDMIDGLLSGLKGAWKAVTDWAKGAMDWIGNIFGGASNSVSSVSSRGPNSNSRTSRMSVQSMPEISTYSVPALARGAVIPPNREFLAVLGDQRHGTNIEAPVSEIEGAVARGMATAGAGGQTTALLQAILEAIKAGKIMVADGRTIAKVVTQEQNRMTRQSGRAVVLT